MVIVVGKALFCDGSHVTSLVVIFNGSSSSNTLTINTYSKALDKIYSSHQYRY